jgi:PEP-CTERM motif
MIKSSILIGALALSAFSAQAATVVTFESLAQPGIDFQSVGTSYSEAGFTFASGNILGFVAAETGNTDSFFGSTALFENAPNAITTLTESGGAAFTLDSIDLAPALTAFPADATITFSGALSGGGTVSQSFTLNNSYLFQTFFFSGFTNLLSVSWSQNYAFHQFDNVVLNSTVPEPGALALVALGLVGMAGLRRKRV